MRILTRALWIAVSFHFVGGSSASVLLIAKGGPRMVTTRSLPSVDLDYQPAAGVEAVQTPESQASMIIAKPTRNVAVPEVRSGTAPGTAPGAPTGGNPQAAVLCNRGLMQMQAGNYKGATSNFESAMKLSPNDPRACMLRGVVAARQGNHAEALGYYARAVRLGPGVPEVYQSRGLSYTKLQRFKEALADFSKVIELDPRFEEGYVRRGLLYGRLGEFEKSVADNTSAIALNANNPLSYNNRAAAYKALGKVQEAEADLQKSRELERRAKGK